MFECFKILKFPLEALCAGAYEIYDNYKMFKCINQNKSIFSLILLKLSMGVLNTETFGWIKYLASWMAKDITDKFLSLSICPPSKVEIRVLFV